jgi:hypothetical protein
VGLDVDRAGFSEWLASRGVGMPQRARRPADLLDAAPTPVRSQG